MSQEIEKKLLELTDDYSSQLPTKYILDVPGDTIEFSLTRSEYREMKELAIKLKIRLVTLYYFCYKEDIEISDILQLYMRIKNETAKS